MLPRVSATASAVRSSAPARSSAVRSSSAPIERTLATARWAPPVAPTRASPALRANDDENFFDVGVACCAEASVSGFLARRARAAANAKAAAAPAISRGRGPSLRGDREVMTARYSGRPNSNEPGAAGHPGFVSCAVGGVRWARQPSVIVTDSITTSVLGRSPRPVSTD